MNGYLGDFTTANTVYVPFHTFDSNDPSASVIVSAFVVGDIAIYKNGSVTQRTSTAGFTLLDTDGINFDTHVGIHGFSVDLSDNTDAGFYSAGGEYFIVVGPVTIDAATVNFVAGSFSIERTGGALALLKGTNSLANIEDKIDIIDTNVDQIETAVITNAAGVDIAADIAVIEGQTDDIGVAGAGLTAIPTIATVTNLTNLPSIPANWLTAAGIAAAAMNGKGDWNINKTGYSLTVAPLTAAQVNTEVDTALTDIHLDHLLAVDYDPAVKPGVATALLNELIESDLGISRFTANALEQAPSGTGASAAVIADAVWDELQADHVTIDTFGIVATEIAAIPTTAMRGTDNAALASVATEARLAELDAANLPTDIAAIPTTAMRGTDGANTTTPPTVLAIADQVWDEAQAGHVAAGSFGIIASEIAAIPTTAMRGTDGANTTTPPTAASIRAEIDTNSTTIADIQGRLPASLAAWGSIQKNTAFSNFEFLMVLSSDDVTPATTLTVTAERSIDGAAFVPVGGAITEISNGMYQFDALTADTNGDVITWRFSAATANDYFFTFKTMA